MTDTLVRATPSGGARARLRRERPAHAVVEAMRVIRSERLSPGYARVVLAGVDDGFDERFRRLGADQWVRLFLPSASGALQLPWGGVEGWHARVLAIPEPQRPAVRNYTIRDARRVGGRWEIDIDFVLHARAGVIEGAAANWALAVRPGDAVGLLDQGVIFQREQARNLVIVADETGLPGVEGILRGLRAGVRARVVLEVAHRDDARPLRSDAEVELRWVVRARDGADPAFGAHTAPDVLEGALFEGADYVYTVGEAGLATAARAAAERAGVPRERVEYCAYWNPARRSHAA